MVSFKLNEEIQKDAFHLVMFLYQAYNLLPFSFYSQNTTLSMLLILAVSRMVSYMTFVMGLAHHRVSVAQW